jgi:hypothetical protein
MGRRLVLLQFEKPPEKIDKSRSHQAEAHDPEYRTQPKRHRPVAVSPRLPHLASYRALQKRDTKG